MSFCSLNVTENSFSFNVSCDTILYVYNKVQFRAVLGNIQNMLGVFGKQIITKKKMMKHNIIVITID